MSQENKVRCSGIKELEKGIDYCFKAIDKEVALELRWERAKQVHDCFFCSSPCLHAFIHHSFWEETDATRD